MRPERKFLRNRATLVAVIGATALFALFTSLRGSAPENPHVISARAPTPEKTTETMEHREKYPTHSNIKATIFWAGEEADASNDFIHNRSSAWVEDWVTAYGGIDDPENRCGYKPCGFTPKENPFYFALPYDDLTDDGDRKPLAKRIPWYQEVIGDDPTSVVKNRWIKITLKDRVAYAQWEDTGPFEYNDFNYVFGNGRPKSKAAGLDLSPATADWLNINMDEGSAKVAWQFIDKADVPDGPWRKTITTSN